MVRTKTISAQLSGRQHLCQGASEKSTANGSHQIVKLSTYLKTRGGLFRLLALFPGNTPVEEAVRLAPTMLTNGRKEVVYV